ncbi:hypothetical protein KM043_007509 [Ampulex compressa]|nr:hypothetical protein KM043_007509 [Ampulex compressa]
MVGHLRVLTTLIIFLALAERTAGENLWCYDCNTDLENGHKAECNDPYVPGHSMNFVACPANESHHCLKSVVLYRNVLVTVRGCVPTREVEEYCRYEIPESSIECYFCKDYACNRQGSCEPSAWNLAFFSVAAIVLFQELTGDREGTLEGAEYHEDSQEGRRFLGFCSRMAYRAEWILAILGLVLLARSGTALRCWDCASNLNSMCGDPMNVSDHQATFHTKICGAGPYETSKSICRKIVKRVNSQKVVIRQCSTPNIDEMDITDGECSPTATAGHGATESCHICSTDLCNSASDASAMHLLYVAALALAGYRFLSSKYGLS